MDIKAAILFALIGLVVYTAFAGLKGDIATDRLHFWIMVVVLFGILVPFVALKVPVGTSLSKIPAQIWSPATFAGYAYVILGIFFGAIIPLVSMELWMRVYASTTSHQARHVFFCHHLLLSRFI